MKKYIFDIDIKERVNISIEADNNNEAVEIAINNIELMERINKNTKAQIDKFRVEGSVKDFELPQYHYSLRFNNDSK